TGQRHKIAETLRYTTQQRTCIKMIFLFYDITLFIDPKPIGNPQFDSRILQDNIRPADDTGFVNFLKNKTIEVIKFSF
ncbi:MAG: hypothetical protein WDZ80_02950, partial [Candidatus Paceibacterota bacterium]